jgi:putative transposase
MPKDLKRYQKTGDLHHVNFSCYHRLPHLHSAAAKELFEKALETMRARYDFFVTAYVVMPDHVHFLVSEPKRATLATAIQAIKLSVAVQRQERPFWQKRYFDRNVWSEAEVIKTRRYIHRNPVRAELVASPDLWRWSSFNHWWTGKPGTVEIESNWTARKRGGLGLRLDADDEE